MQSQSYIAADAAESLLSLPFDHYQRYDLTRRIIACLWGSSGKALEVLDVGGHMSSLKLFLSHCRLVVADPLDPPMATHRGLPFLCDAYVKAQGQALPFRDDSFDLVTAHDTLEHIPDGQRSPFLREMLRVARCAVIVNGPVHLDETRIAEERLASFIECLFDSPNPSLMEHLRLGLPDPTLVESAIREEGLPFVAIPNGNLASWLMLMVLKHYLAALPQGEVLDEALDRAYNAAISPQDFNPPCYRVAYVIAKERGCLEALEQLRSPLHTISGTLAFSPQMGQLEELMRRLESHAAAARSMQRELGEKEELLRKREAELQKKTALLSQKDHLLAEKDAHIANIEAALHHANLEAASTRHQLDQLTHSVGYRLLERARQVIRWLMPQGSLRYYFFLALRRGINVILTRGWRAFLARLVRVWEWLPALRRPWQPDTPQPSLDEQYQRWLQAHTPTERDLDQMRQAARRLSYQPLISIIMPVYNPDPTWLREAIESVRAQVYERWELCIADDGSTRPGVREVLEEFAGSDGRIRVTYLERNEGISAASNAALSLARGEFAGFLDHDDELKPEALFEVVKALNEDRALDVLYTDEDKRAPDGRLVEPFFKPDWSPDLLMSVNYIAHFSLLRRSLVEEVGGFRQGYEGSQDYDLILRVTELTDRVAHIAKPLYTWRKVPGSTAASLDAKKFAYRAGKRALQDALRRRGIRGEVREGLHRGYYRVKYEIKGRPKVSIIIPTRDRVEMLRRCIGSIESRSTYRHYEIIVVDNDSRDPETLEYLAGLRGRVIRYPYEFNYSKIVNLAAREAQGDALLFLNNDTEVISPGWIEAMLEQGQRPEVAAVGARLFYPDGRIQHEGIILGLGGGSAGNVDHAGYFGLGETVHNCSAVTGACMLTRSSVFWELGGFDEGLRVAFNDVDYCLRARQRGYLVVYTPFANLYHYESATRGRLHPQEDERLFRARWGNPGERWDPYYNRNLDLLRPFSLRL